MAKVLTVTELVRNFADYINRVAYRGERFRVTRGGKLVAELGPLPSGKSLAELPYLVESLPSLSDDEARDFASDIDEARAGLTQHPPTDRWTS